jgi:hypothetical protein
MWTPLALVLACVTATEPAPVQVSAPAGATALAPVAMRPRYAEGDVIKVKWTLESEDVREGEKISEEQKRSLSYAEVHVTFRVDKLFPENLLRGTMTFTRVVIEASVPNGRERYDSADPKTSGSWFESPAQILLKRPLEFMVSGDVMGYTRKEHPRLREWHHDGTGFLDNTVGDDAWPARFGLFFCWFAEQEAVGNTWKVTMPMRVNAGFSIPTKQEFKLVSDDGVKMQLKVSGVGTESPEAATKGLKFIGSTYDAMYSVNTASARIREGEATHVYTCEYMWQGAPAKVTTTMRETIERVD